MSIDIHFNLIHSIQFFKDNFSPKFLTAMSSIVSEERYGPDEIIYSREQPCDFLYILKKGEISQYITMDDKKKTLKILETFKDPYSIFGQLDFMLGYLHSSDCKSNIVSYVLKISRADLNDLLMKFPSDYVSRLRVHPTS